MAAPYGPDDVNPQIEATPEADETMHRREAGDVPDARAALVTKLSAQVRSAKRHWEDSFRRMIDDMDFAFGRQWSLNDNDYRYKANITIRHVQTSTAAIFAKNPTVKAKRRQTIDYTVWDGEISSVEEAKANLEAVQQAQQAIVEYQVLAAQLMEQRQVMLEGTRGPEGKPLSGDLPMVPPPPPPPPDPDPMSMAVLEDFRMVMARRSMLDRVAKTLELCYTHFQNEQATGFKVQMKNVVRRAKTCGVGYVQLGYQRAMDRDPDVERQLADCQLQLQDLQRMIANQHDGETDSFDAEAEQLRLSIAALESKEQILVREGLTYEFPFATAVIPDEKCRSLQGFIGCDWVTRQYLLSSDEVQSIWGVDVGGQYKSYREGNDDVTLEAAKRDRSHFSITAPATHMTNGEDGEDGISRDVLVWIIYHKTNGLVYTICDGYSDFLEEPSAPKISVEGFWPVRALVFNETEHTNEIYPPSDVRLIKDAQMEYNRAREGLREHRRAKRPKTIVASGRLTEVDEAALRNHPANAVIQLQGLQPGEEVDKLLQPWGGPAIDPALYDENPAMSDVQRTVGSPELQRNRDTATQSAIDEGARLSSLESNVDDLDQLLSDLARDGGQILMQEMSPATAMRLAGPGAAWPETDRQTIVEELFLEVKAGSSGRPNKVQDAQNFQQVTPLLQSLPGMKPTWLAEKTFEIMGWEVDLADAYDENQPSITAQNAIDTARVGAGGPQAAPANPVGANAPGAQGPMGGAKFNVNEPEAQVPSAPVGRDPISPVNVRAVLGNQ